ncbi:Ferri-bacillibactin esterase BesA [Lasiodiplodia theobromae]|uniref:Ferri-bacillibactin esterase BesA n=1 Tax=Lasiodiplodia theobromae TaxID=45133 RepID=A0A5N5CZ07_9PEZI|nr:Ferri-bacillibactin esterase BesA [Lasiodiplodia theobromae]
MDPLEPAAAPNTCQHTLRTRRGDYLIQASWPPAWGEDRKSPTDRPVPIVYLVDGNAYFFSATELVRRIRHLPNGAGNALVVAIGYPALRSALHQPRRSADLTPPSPTYAPVLGRDGKPLAAEHGGAAEFLDAIEKEVVPFVAKKVFPDVRIGPQALWGHSYGGLFALYALFTRPRLFDTVVAASPSVWWNERRIVQVEREYRRGKRRGEEEEEEQRSHAPQLFVMYGSDEQFPKRFHHESEEEFAVRKKLAAERRMKDNAIEMGSRLRDSGLLRKVWLQEFQDEDHGSAALCALSRGITGFLEACSY